MKVTLARDAATSAVASRHQN